MCKCQQTIEVQYMSYPSVVAASNIWFRLCLWWPRRSLRLPLVSRSASTSITSVQSASSSVELIGRRSSDFVCLGWWWRSNRFWNYRSRLLWRRFCLSFDVRVLQRLVQVSSFVRPSVVEDGCEWLRLVVPVPKLWNVRAVLQSIIKCWTNGF